MSVFRDVKDYIDEKIEDNPVIGLVVGFSLITLGIVVLLW